MAELITDGLVYETGLGESSGGRKPLMLLFNSRAGFVLGIEVSVQYIKGALTDLAGTIETELTFPLRSMILLLLWSRFKNWFRN